MILVDSSVWIGFFNGRPTPQTLYLRDGLGEANFVTGDLILTERLQGFRSNAAAQNYRRLRARGVTVRKTIDVIIATFCISGSYTLLHADRDFDTLRDHLGLATLEF